MTLVQNSFITYKQIYVNEGTWSCMLKMMNELRYLRQSAFSIKGKLICFLKALSNEYGRELFHLLQSVFQYIEVNEFVYWNHSLLNVVKYCFIFYNLLVQ